MLVEVYKDVETSILRGYMIAQLAYMILGLREFGGCSEIGCVVVRNLAQRCEENPIKIEISL